MRKDRGKKRATDKRDEKKRGSPFPTDDRGISSRLKEEENFPQKKREKGKDSGHNGPNAEKRSRERKRRLSPLLNNKKKRRKEEKVLIEILAARWSSPRGRPWDEDSRREKGLIFLPFRSENSGGRGPSLLLSSKGGHCVFEGERAEKKKEGPRRGGNGLLLCGICLLVGGRQTLLRQKRRRRRRGENAVINSKKMLKRVPLLPDRRRSSSTSRRREVRKKYLRHGERERLIERPEGAEKNGSFERERLVSGDLREKKGSTQRGGRERAVAKMTERKMFFSGGRLDVREPKEEHPGGGGKKRVKRSVGNNPCQWKRLFVPGRALKKKNGTSQRNLQGGMKRT